jgi:hypothetical protein
VGDLAAQIARIRDLIEKELRRDFPQCGFQQLPRGWWCAWYGETRVMAPDAGELRARLDAIVPGDGRDLYGLRDCS